MLFTSFASFSSIEDYLYSDIGATSNVHGEIGLINIPSSRILEEGNLKLHLVNSDPINSLFITSTPFDWMEVSLRYSDINTIKYSPYPSFSGDQTYKDKSFNLKIRLIEETETFPELSVGFRDLIGTGLFSGEYLVSSKKIGDFDFTVGVGWGSLSSSDGLDNPFIDLSEDFQSRDSGYWMGGEIRYDRWFTGKKISSFYGIEYVNKYSGLRFKLDFDKSNPFQFDKKSNLSFGIAIPASNFIDINLVRHRGTDIGFGISYKANYSKDLISKNEYIPEIYFNDSDKKLLRERDDVFSGTINTLLSPYGLFTQEIYLDDKEKKVTLIINNSKYKNQNIATKRTIEIIKEILQGRNIKKVSIVYEQSNIFTNVVSFPLEKFISFLDNSYSVPEIKKHLSNETFDALDNTNRIFKGNINFPIFSWGITPNLRNHVGAPESFYSGQLGFFVNGGVAFDKSSSLDGSISLNLYSNMDQLKLKAFSRLPKVRSDIREYLKNKNSLSSLTYTKLFKTFYRNDSMLISGAKLGLFEEMYGGIGSAFLYRNIAKPWFLTGNFYWVKQREFNQRFSFRKYETFTGHLSFVWETPLQGMRLSLTGGRYLAKDSGITLNLSKTFKSGFTLGAFATKTDISAYEFGEGSFDKGIYFSIPLDIVSKNYQKNHARFIWRNLTKDGGAILSGGLELEGFIDGTSNHLLDFYQDGLLN